MSDHNACIETLWAAYEYWSTGLGGSQRSDFDQLIAAHDAEVAANAWDEGRQWLAEQAGDVTTYEDPNPYRPATAS